ncbi:Cerevisin [Dactylellina cionopaga]|nr:Cerevisin [Dactylellina cionopaga]
MKSIAISFVYILAAASCIGAAPTFTANAAEDEYIVVLKDHDKRPWPEVFADMGYNQTKKHTQIAAASENGIQGFGATYATTHGAEIRTFGTNFRAFKMKMPKSHSVSIQSLPNVAFLEKNNIRTKQVPQTPSQPSNPAHGAPKRWRRGIEEWKNKRFIITRRQLLNNGTIPANGTAPVNGTLPVGGTTPTNGTSELIQQNTAPWNLQRISSEKPIPADGRLITELTYKYRFERASGAGVDVYIVDSGINVTHPDFGGRAKIVFSAFQDDGRDGDGHGTHVAGTVGSLHFGVAKNANIFGCKVLDDQGGGSDDGIAAGIDAALTSHLQRKDLLGFAGSIINLSLGSPNPTQVIFDVLQRAAQAGMHVTIAPGNDNKDACTDFPAGFNKQIPSLFSVGAADIDDIRAEFSDNGPCVDLHGPGVGIVSTSADGNTAVKDGTSMATPAVAGMIAIELVKNPNLKLDPLGMKQHILSLSQKGAIKAKPGDNAPDGGRNLLNSGLPGNP